MSMLVYFLTIFYLNEYINIASLNYEFLTKIAIIVASSWLMLYILDKIGECFSPPYTRKVLREHEPILPPANTKLKSDIRRSSASEDDYDVPNDKEYYDVDLAVNNLAPLKNNRENERLL